MAMFYKDKFGNVKILKKIVIIVTGMQEHSNRYDYLATILNKNSYQYIV